MKRKKIRSEKETSNYLNCIGSLIFQQLDSFGKAESKEIDLLKKDENKKEYEEEEEYDFPYKLKTKK